MKKLITCALFVLGTLSPLGGHEKNHPPLIVATTSWTAAFAKAAGGERVLSLTPSGVVHPPEYELRLSEIQTVKQADFVVFAGYEKMVKRLKGHRQGTPSSMIQIKTSFALPVIKRSLLDIASQLGTEDQAQKSYQSIVNLYRKSANLLKQAGLHEASVWVHFFQRPLAEALGLSVVGVFGPGPLEAKTIAEAGKKGGQLIIDNDHSPQGKPLLGVLPEASLIRWINFPGVEETVSLEDVVRYNVDQLLRNWKTSSKP